MTGLSSVAARMAAIEGQLAQLARPTQNSRLGAATTEFDQVLNEAISTSDAGLGAATSVLPAPAVSVPALGPTSTPTVGPALTPAEQRTPGAYGSLTPPADLLQYGNGRVPTEALEPIGETGHHLWAPAANGFNQLLADAEAAGITIGITDSYRPLHVQERLAVEKGLYSQGGLAARPGTSNHGWGMATDLDLDGSALEWMRDNGWRYGFVEDVPREPWHWTYRPAS